MAWRCSAMSNAGLISNLFQAEIIKSDKVAQAMRNVDRAHFVLDKQTAYQDSPQTIGEGATISAPHMHAQALQHLLPYLAPGAHVLDVGSGSGYLCAALHHLVSPPDSDIKGKVVGIDHIPALGERSIENLNKAGFKDALGRKEIEIVVGDGRKGYPPGGPYAAIHVGAAAPTVPEALVNQLACPGSMFIPVGTAYQEIVQIDKDEHGQVTKKRLMGVIYVPLTDPEKQTGRRV